MGNSQIIIDQQDNAYYAYSLDFPQIVVSDRNQFEAMKKLELQISKQLLAIRRDLESLLEY
jgi:hypothetical protein